MNCIRECLNSSACCQPRVAGSCILPKSSRNSMCEPRISVIYKAKVMQSMTIQAENLAVLRRLGDIRSYVIQEDRTRTFCHKDAQYCCWSDASTT